MMARKLNVLLLIVNFGLLAGMVYFWLRNRPVAEEVASTATEGGAGAEAPTNEPLVITNVQREVITNQFHWGQLESEDYRTYIARLRSIGCPEQTIRDIIIADLDKLFAPKISLASGHRKNLKYWEPEEEELCNDWDPRDIAQKMQEIDRQKREVIQ